MKKKEGFTLIEILATIVVLAILALITTPLVMRQVEQSRKSAFRESVIEADKGKELYLEENKTTMKEFISEEKTNGISVEELKKEEVIKSKLIRGEYVQIEGKSYAYYVEDERYCAYGPIDDLKIGKSCKELDGTEAFIKDFHLSSSTNSITVLMKEEEIYDLQSGIKSITINLYLNDKKIDTYENVDINKAYTFKGLKNNTIYKVELEVINGNNIEGNKNKEIKTYNIEAPDTTNVTPQGWTNGNKKAVIKYKDENITNPVYYIKLSSGKISGNVKAVCGSGTNPGECTETEEEIEVGKWYQVSEKEENLTILDNSTVIAVTYDGTNYGASSTLNVSTIDKTAPVLKIGDVSKTTTSITIPIIINGDPNSGIKETICEYKLKESTNWISSNATLTETMCKITGLTSNKEYDYRIITKNNTVKEAPNETEDNARGTTEVSSLDTTGSSNVTFEYNSGWATSKAVTVKYAASNITTPTYYVKTTVAGTSSVGMSSCGTGANPGTCTSTTTTTLAAGTWYKTTNTAPIITIKENGSITGLIHDGDKYSTSSTVSITKIDTTKPTISLSSNSNTTYAKTRSITVTLNDSESGIAGGASIKYGWSTSNTTAPTSYTTATLSYSAGANEVTFTATSSGLTGRYYLWVVPTTLKDVAGNSLTTNRISDVFYFDNTAPTAGTLTMKLGSSSGNNYTNNTWTNQYVYTAVKNGSDADSGHKSTECKTHADEVISGSKTFTTTASSPYGYGGWIITCTTTDNVGNTATNTYNIKIDKTPPTIEFGTNGNSTYATSQSSTIKVSSINSYGNEAGSPLDTTTYKYIWSSSKTAIPSTTFTSGSTYKQSTGTGDYYLIAKACDTAGNCTTKTSSVFKLDNIGQTTGNIEVVDANCKNANTFDTCLGGTGKKTSGTWYKTDSIFRFNVDTKTIGPSGYTIQYCISDGANSCSVWNSYTNQTEITYGTEGSKYINFRIKNNSSTDYKYYNFLNKIDKTAPTIKYVVSNNNTGAIIQSSSTSSTYSDTTWRSYGYKFSFTFTDSGSGGTKYLWKWNTGNQSTLNKTLNCGSTSCSNTYTPATSTAPTLTGSGVRYATMEACDAVGNCRTVNLTVYIDTTKPKITYKEEGSSLGTTSATRVHNATFGLSGFKSSSWKCEYGTSTSYGSTGTMANNTSSSGVCAMSGLKAGTKYYYKMTVQSNSGLEGTYTGSFTTKSATPPKPTYSNSISDNAVKSFCGSWCSLSYKSLTSNVSCSGNMYIQVYSSSATYYQIGTSSSSSSCTSVSNVQQMTTRSSHCDSGAIGGWPDNVTLGSIEYNSEQGVRCVRACNTSGCSNWTLVYVSG